MIFNLKSKTMPFGKYKGQTMYYAHANKGRTISFEEVVQDISEMSSLTTGDVRNAIDRIAYYLRRELMAGNTVQLGQIGTFQILANGRYVTDPSLVDATTVKRPKLKIIANNYLRSAVDGYRVMVDNPYKKKGQPAPPSTIPGGSGSGGTSEGSNSGLPEAGL
ncbi:MAG: histidinol phosphate aminotransferase [Porphyromonadaceae bacterium]|nr:histidinol phosphate aminotransferase [Porphyromonadaceae bacterium]